MESIHFFSEEVDFILKNKATTRNWIKSVTKNHKRKIACINYIFVSDEYLKRINIDFLNHDTYTDIITFDQSDNTGSLEGDIFISIDRVRDNSADQNIPFEEELHRVMIHGILHMLGMNDKTASEKEEMRKKENHYLALR
jgi:probable rRNA maturation factor